MKLPETPEEYTQFALEYSGKAFFEHPAIKTFAAFFVHSLREYKHEWCMDELAEWISYTIKKYPELVSVAVIQNEIEYHISVKICQVQITAYVFSEFYPEPKNPKWCAARNALKLYNRLNNNVRLTEE